MATNTQDTMSNMPPRGTQVLKSSKPHRARAYKFTLNSKVPKNMATAAAHHQRNAPHEALRIMKPKPTNTAA